MVLKKPNDAAAANELRKSREAESISEMQRILLLIRSCLISPEVAYRRGDAEIYLMTAADRFGEINLTV